MLHEGKIILLIIFLISTFFVETYIFHDIKLKKSLINELTISLFFKIRH